MKKKLPIILIVMLLLLLVGAGGFLFLRTQEGSASHVALTSVIVTGKRTVAAEDPDHEFGKYYIRFQSPSFSSKAGQTQEWDMPLHTDAEILYDAIFVNKDYMLFQVLITVPAKDLKELSVIGNDGNLDPYKILSDPALVKKYARIVSVQAE